MAKPKEKTGQLSAAFHEKSGKEKDRLRKKLAKQLKEDIESMLQEEIHPDLDFTVKGGDSVGHRLILKARARSLWDVLCQGRTGGENAFKLPHLDKTVWDAYLFQVYGSEQADLAAEELMVAMEERSQPRGNVREDVCGSRGYTLQSPGGTQNESNRADNPVARTRAERFSVDSLEDGQARNTPDMSGTADTQRDNHTTDGEHGMAVGGQPEFAVFDLYQGAYNLDMMPSAHFAAGQDYLAADPSSLFVLPNGQEINNNDANNNGLDANQVMPDQNLRPQVEPRVVNLEPQVMDLVSHAIVPPHSSSAAPVSLLADIQTQQRSGSANSIGAHAELPDVIKASYCTALPHQTCSRLGQDLLRAYLQEIDCDCTISVGNQDFKCHRCILAARSTYFTAMLGGRWLESEADKIVLEGVSASAVEQALLYIYGGVCDLTDQCVVCDLIVLSDMYGLEGLKDVISLHLRMVKCHFFHKPCGGCMVGVVETLSIAERYRLEELADRCMKWINKNFTKIWPTKVFAQLPEATLQACCKSAIQDLHPDTVLDVIMDCDKLSTCLPRLKWTEPVLDLITLLMDSAMEFTSQRFTSVLASDRFIALGKSQAWSMGLLDTIFGSVIKSLPVDHICDTYLAVHRLVEWTKDENCTWTEDFQGFVGRLLEKCEGYIRLYIHQVVHSRDWEKLTKDLQQHLLQSSSYVCIDAHRGRAPPKLSSMNRKPISLSGLKSHPVKSLNPSKTKAQAASLSKLEKSATSGTVRSKVQKVQTAAEPSCKMTGQTGFDVRSRLSSTKGTKLRTQSAIPRLKRRTTSDKNSRPYSGPRQISRSVENTPYIAAAENNEDSRLGITRATADITSVIPHSYPGAFVDKQFSDDSLAIVDVTTNFQDMLLDSKMEDPPAGTCSDGNFGVERDMSNPVSMEQSEVVRSEEHSSSSEEVEDLISSKSDSYLPPNYRSHSVHEDSALQTKVPRSRSEDLSILRNGEHYILQLHPIFEAKFVLPKGPFHCAENF